MDNAGGLVPEIYYDLIARMASGAPFVLLVLFLYQFNYDKMDGFLAFGIFIGLSFVTGHVLSTLSAALNYWCWPRGVLNRLVRRAKILHPLDTTSATRMFDDIYTRIDLISLKYGDLSTILKKMEAGASLSDNLFSGWLLFSLIAIICIWLGDGDLRYELFPNWSDWQLYLVLIAIAGLLLATVVVRRVVFVTRQDRIWSIYLELDRAPAVGPKDI